MRMAGGLAYFACMASAAYLNLICKFAGQKQLDEEQDDMQPCTGPQAGTLLVWCWLACSAC